MAGKFALFAFNGEPICFVHVLLNALDYDAKGYEAKIVMEGESTKLIEHFENPDVPFAGLYKKCIDQGLIDCVCRACSNQMGVLKLAEEKGMPLCDDMSGHPSMEGYTKEGFEIITF
ncbi:MAG: cytoplasmic protein [Spirochaetia bacterium]